MKRCTSRTAWRATGWWPDHYSIAIFDITKVRGGSKLKFTQIGIPPSRYSGHYRGWIETVRGLRDEVIADLQSGVPEALVVYSDAFRVK